LFYYQSEDFFCLSKDHIGPPNYADYQPRMGNNLEHVDRSLFKHMMPFWCPFLDSHLTIYHSNVGA
jgi:hypothetical protein